MKISIKAKAEKSKAKKRLCLTIFYIGIIPVIPILLIGLIYSIVEIITKNWTKLLQSITDIDIEL